MSAPELWAPRTISWHDAGGSSSAHSCHSLVTWQCVTVRKHLDEVGFYNRQFYRTVSFIEPVLYQGLLAPKWLIGALSTELHFVNGFRITRGSNWQISLWNIISPNSCINSNASKSVFIHVFSEKISIPGSLWCCTFTGWHYSRTAHLQPTRETTASCENYSTVVLLHWSLEELRAHRKSLGE